MALGAKRNVNALMVLALMWVGGCFPPPNNNPHGNALAYFDKVWDQFNRNYSHFPAKAKLGVDWDQLWNVYRPLFDQELSTDQVLDLIAQMLAELQDLHVVLLNPSGQPVEVYSRPGAQNWLGGYPYTYFPWGVSKLNNKYPLRHGWMADNIAYLSIESFDGDSWNGLRTSELDTLFATYAGADGMIVDIRRNSGGSENVAKAIAGYFTHSQAVYGYTRDRIVGNDRNAFASAVAHTLQPSASYRFSGYVVLLTSEVNMSSAEWFVLMMDACPNVYLMGDKTRGSSGNPKSGNGQEDFVLDNGISYLIPSWEAFDAEMNPIEDCGIEPHEWYEAASCYNESEGRDYLLERAVEWLLE